MILKAKNSCWKLILSCQLFQGQEIYSTIDFTNSSWTGNDYWHYYLSDSVFYISLSLYPHNSYIDFYIFWTSWNLFERGPSSNVERSIKSHWWLWVLHFYEDVTIITWTRVFNSRLFFLNRMELIIFWSFHIKCWCNVRRFTPLVPPW